MYYSPYIPTINPVILEIYGPFAIRWYSLAYITGILFCLMIAKMLIRKYPSKITEKDADDFVPLAIIAVILGGRLGHVFIYEPEYYLTHPLDIIKTYEGGMSFHGAVVSMALYSLIFCYKRKIPFLQATDLTLCGASMGIFLGRIANFINGELFGKITSSPLGVIFYTAEPANIPRHPSQLYEALLEGALLLIISLWLAFKTRKLKDEGFITGVWVILYSVFRFVTEYYREPDGIVNLSFIEISTGQALSIIMAAAGFMILAFRHKSVQAQ
jgi:phosphatidylglycerol:prolipoprotein diacylglycerol transferase